ncbi:hypothetical protein D9758_017685 [Tetrapyrgos nigripes]|uniref:Uncharacterized protein n=1 Tax=Tetrapyrgos nigripes TaxID=182062 RepID=A0A8H5C6M8_9AGAR|nr:hypothetical protein D9758_017685 [Tetrapyrgos nigripes]
MYRSTVHPIPSSQLQTLGLFDFAAVTKEKEEEEEEEGYKMIVGIRITSPGGEGEGRGVRPKDVLVSSIGEMCCNEEGGGMREQGKGNEMASGFHSSFGWPTSMQGAEKEGGKVREYACHPGDVNIYVLSYILLPRRYETILRFLSREDERDG